jgi:hypothetical protein
MLTVLAMAFQLATQTNDGMAARDDFHAKSRDLRHGHLRRGSSHPHFCLHQPILASPRSG